MASFSNSRSVWFTTLLIFLFFWNLFHNSDTLAPPQIEIIEEYPQDTITGFEDLASVYPDPPEPDLYEPDLAIEVGVEDDDYFYAKPPDEGFSWKHSKPKVPPKDSSKLPSAIVHGDKLIGADPKNSNEFPDITAPDPALDPTVPIDPVISYGTHQENIHIQNSDKATHMHDRPLVVYVYRESQKARTNFRFFVKHGLQSTSDFIIILNGVTDAERLLPSPMPSNVRIIQRQKECNDLGIQAEVLLEHDSELALKYKQFILMNSNVRGPFLPSWSKQCWTEAYLSKLNETVKLVGMSYDCIGGQKRLQSSLWALDSEGLDVILKLDGVNQCFQSKDDALVGETQVVALLKSKGYQVDVVAQPENSVPSGKTSGASSKTPGSADFDSDSHTLDSSSMAHPGVTSFSNSAQKGYSGGFGIESSGMDASQFGSSGVEENVESAISDATDQAFENQYSADEEPFEFTSQVTPIDAGIGDTPANIMLESTGEENNDIESHQMLENHKDDVKKFSGVGEIVEAERPTNGSSSLGDFDTKFGEFEEEADSSQPEIFEDLSFPTAESQLKSSKIPNGPASDFKLDEEEKAEPNSEEEPLEASSEDDEKPEDEDDPRKEEDTKNEEDITDDELPKENASAAFDPAYLDRPPTEDSSLEDKSIRSVRKRDSMFKEDFSNRECTGKFANIHPYANMFVEIGDSGGESETIRMLTEEHFARSPSSYDVCF